MMSPLIYTNSIAAGIFWAAYLIWAVPEFVGIFTQRARASRKDASIQDRGSLGMVLGLLLLSIILNFVLASLLWAATITWQRPILFGIGVSLMLLGVGLRWYAIWTLGRFFTRDVAVSADQQVVQTGPYRYIRHPSYSGTLLTVLGLGLALTNWVGLLVSFLCAFLGHLYRVRMEEQALAQTLGQSYVDYMRRTKRFLPGVF